MPLDAGPQIANLSLTKQRERWWLEEDRVERLSIYWEMGYTCTAIAEKLGTSKNSVIGKARRLDLPMRAEGKKSMPTSTERLAKLIPPGGCRWPSGDPARPETFSYCSDKVYEQKSYCLHHFIESVSWEATSRAGITKNRLECDCKKCKRKKNAKH
jgi:hypothetical protein